MVKLDFTLWIARSPEAVYQVLSDLHGYPSWLSNSNLFQETREISDNPVKVGTTYVDKGPSSVMKGVVTELERYSRIAFHQVIRIVGKDVLVIAPRYTLQPEGDGTLVARELTLQMHGLLWFLQPILVLMIRREDERILQQLKRYMETQWEDGNEPIY
jgi:uncharacterized protein YndB with AHSA1/START domain